MNDFIHIYPFFDNQVLVPFNIGRSISVYHILYGLSIGFSPLRCWGGLYRFWKQSKSKYTVLVPFDVGVVYILHRSIKISLFQFQSPSMLGWSISVYLKRQLKIVSFSPLRYWGGLYQVVNDKIALSICFSPLRYWGGLYLINEVYKLLYGVLVPFDIGVVYIENEGDDNSVEQFQSPSILGWSIS